MHTLMDNGNGTYNVVFVSGDKQIMIEQGWNKQDARTMVHFLNGGSLDCYGGVVYTDSDK